MRSSSSSTSQPVAARTSSTSARLVVAEEHAQPDRIAQRRAVAAPPVWSPPVGIERVVFEHAPHAARVVHGHFQAFDVDDVLLAVLAQPACRRQGAVREQLAQRPLAVGQSGRPA